MPISFETDQTLQQITIAISGHFDFRLVGEFRQAYDAIESPKKVIIDLKQADYIDSSGLGILIYLRKHFGCHNGNIYLVNANAEIKKTLRIARFNKMFIIGSGDELSE